MGTYNPLRMKVAGSMVQSFQVISNRSPRMSFRALLGNYP